MHTRLPFLLAAMTAAVAAQEAAAPPVEYGKIAWQRDFASAEAAAKTASKPLLVLFQEVPG